MADEKVAEKVKDAANNGMLRLVLLFIAGLVLLTGFIIFLVWLILQPKKPEFILQDITLYSLNITQPNYLTTSLQVTLTTKNPNAKVGISYEKVDVFASYHNQQITLATLLPKTYQAVGDMAVWSPFLYGTAVPVSDTLSSSLNLDLNAGVVLVDIKVDGRLKWKIGSMLTAKYRFNVNCPAYITFGSQSKGINLGSAIKYQFVQGCTVEI